MSEPLPIKRCAIYSRSSVKKGNRDPFDSVSAQFMACAEFIGSQVGQGWRLLDTIYEDNRNAIYTLLLKNRAYLGEVFYAENWQVGAHEAIVDLNLWSKVDALLEARSRRGESRIWPGA
jgi:hypothetical protein